MTRAPSVAVWSVDLALGQADPRVEIVAHELAVDPSSVCFVAGDNGRPTLHCPDADAGAADLIDANVSHSGGRLLVAVARGVAVGVDVEQHRPRNVERIATRVFVADELAAWHDEPDPLAGFYRMWARKEAVLKAEGRGLFSLRAAIATPAAPGWSVVDLDVGEGWSAAVATPSAAVDVRLHTWPPPIRLRT